MRLADYIASFLVDNGIHDAFSVVGGGAMFLNDALGHKEGLHVTYNHHEQACAIAAEGYARLTQNIAAVCVTTGPGGTNALTGVLGGWLDSIPMLVISGQVKFSTTVASTDVPVRQLGDQEWHIVDTVRDMTKYAVMVTNPEEIAYHLEKALWLATNGRPGPSWIDVPINVQSADIDPESLTHFNPSAEESLLPSHEIPEPVSDDDVDRLFSLIHRAKAPVILAGAGIRTGHAYEGFKAFVEKVQVPVCTAWNAHDLMDDDDPLYVGRPGTVGTRGGNFAIQNADLLISLACRMNIRQISYNYENFAKEAFKVAVDIDSAELQKPTLSIDFPIHADIAEFFDKANASPESFDRGEHSDWLSWCRELNSRYPADLPSYADIKSPVNPYYFLDVLSQELPDDAVTVTSNGAACVCSFQVMRVRDGQRLFTNSAVASMGYGLPAALGATVARAGKPVLCIEGDGSLMMNIQELETVSYNHLNLKIVILNNDGYHSIRQTQTNTFNANFAGVDPDSGVGFPCWQKVADAFEIPFFRIDSTDDLAEMIAGFLATDGPAICEAVVGHAQNFEPKLSSRKLEDGTIVSPTLEDMSPFLDRDEFESIAYPHHADLRG
jgi:acetolactate synthase-1/2/3 large subunit